MFWPNLWPFSGRCCTSDMLRRPLCKPTNPAFAWIVRARPRKAVRMAGVPAN